jgi:hypothetical protein
MPSKLDLLENKVHKLVEELLALRKDNVRLKSELETLQSQISLTGGESRKAQRFLAEYEQMKRSHEQAKHRVERALQKLGTLSLH